MCSIIENNFGQVTEKRHSATFFLRDRSNISDQVLRQKKTVGIFAHCFFGGTCATLIELLIEF